MIHNMTGTGFIIAAILTVALAASPEVKVTVERNTGKDATPEFKFKNVPSPVKDDAAAHAKLKLVLGQGTLDHLRPGM